MRLCGLLIQIQCRECKAEACPDGCRWRPWRTSWAAETSILHPFRSEDPSIVLIITRRIQLKSISKTIQNSKEITITVLQNFRKQSSKSTFSTFDRQNHSPKYRVFIQVSRRVLVPVGWLDFGNHFSFGCAQQVGCGQIRSRCEDFP